MLMSKIEIFLSSKASWSLVGIFLISGLEAIRPELKGTAATIIQIVLGLLAAYFHPQELQVAGVTGKIGIANIRKY